MEIRRSRSQAGTGMISRGLLGRKGQKTSRSYHTTPGIKPRGSEISQNIISCLTSVYLRKTPPFVYRIRNLARIGTVECVAAQNVSHAQHACNPTTYRS